MNLASVIRVSATMAVVVVLVGSYDLVARSSTVVSSPAPSASPTAKSGEDHLQLSMEQRRVFKIAPVMERPFRIDCDAVGVVDLNQNRTVQVSSPWTGRVKKLFVRPGNAVTQGQILFTIESPDLVQAESALIAAAGARRLTKLALARARELAKIDGISQKDLEQRISDEQAAEGTYQAAMSAVRIFGKSDTEIRQIIVNRRVDGELAVHSPINGVVTSRNASPGMLVQPGIAPYTISDLSSKWLLASVTEADLPFVQVGQAVEVRLLAYPERIFKGKVTRVDVGLDPDNHRATVESQVQDRENLLRPQMMATFTIHTSDAISSPAVPETAVVREGDGTMRVWVAVEQNNFVARVVKTGIRQKGFVQILEGLQVGDLVVIKGGVFLSNMLVSGNQSE